MGGVLAQWMERPVAFVHTVMPGNSQRANNTQ